MIDISEKLDEMLNALEKLPHIAIVEDNRDTFRCVTVTLKSGYRFKNGMQHADFKNISQAVKGCDLSQIN